LFDGTFPTAPLRTVRATCRCIRLSRSDTVSASVATKPTLTSIREGPDNFLDKLHYTTRSCKCPRSSRPCPPSPCPPRYERRLATTGTPSPWGSRPVGDPAFRSSGRDSSVSGPPFGDFDVRHGTRSGLGVPRGWRHLDQPYLSCHELRHGFLPD